MTSTTTYSTINKALEVLERLIHELEKEALQYNKRIAANGESWERNKIYLQEKNKLIQQLCSINNTLNKLNYHDQWLHIQTGIESIQNRDPETSAVKIIIPLKLKIDYARTALIDLSIR